MALFGRSPNNRRAGDAGLAWHAPNLAGPATLTLRSPDFEHEATIPTVHAGKRVGGSDLSPALNWQSVPVGAAALLLVIEDPDAPTPKPFNHGVALLDPTLTSLARGALDAENPAAGVRPLRSGMGCGYLGPAPIKGHGPHRYVFQLFAVARPVTEGPRGAHLDRVKPSDLLPVVTDVLARGRLDGYCERP